MSEATLASNDCAAASPLSSDASSSAADVFAVSGLARRTARGVGAFGFGAVINLAAQLSTVPVAMYCWGKVRYGEWVLLAAAVLILKLSDLGLQSFVVNRMCAQYAVGNRDAVLHDLHSALRTQLPLAVALFGTVAALVSLLPVDAWLGIRTLTHHEFVWVVLLLAAELLVAIPGGVMMGCYRATGNIARNAMAGNFQTLGALIMTLSLMLVGFGFVAIAAARVVVQVVTQVACYFDLHRQHAWFRLSTRIGNWTEGWRFVGPGMFFLLIPICDYVAVQVTLIVVQKYWGSSDVSTLATHRTVVNMAVLACNLLLYSITPEITALHARNELDKLGRVHSTLTKLSVWIVGFALLAALPAISILYPIWTVRRLSLDWVTLLILSARTILYAQWSASLVLLTSINRQKTASLVIAASTMLILVMALLLVPQLGIRGAVTATLVGELALAGWLIPRLAARECGRSTTAVLSENLRAIAPFIMIGALELALWVMAPNLIVRFCLLWPAGALAAAAWAWRSLDDAERRTLLRQLPRRLIARGQLRAKQAGGA
jgi:O-antigen/teichoic acid export membrane protein